MSESTSPVDRTPGTTLLMSASAVFMGVLGLSVSFVPQTVLSHLGVRVEGPLLVLLNVLGAAYLGFAGLNWMARHHLIGGIYSRPVAIGNFVHFFVASVALGKHAVLTTPPLSIVLITGGYAILAAGFIYVAFTGG